MSAESDRHWRMGMFAAALMLPFWFLMWGPEFANAATSEFTAEQRAVLHAILMVESGGREDPPDGDGGRAIGPYQIHEIYWKDAMEADPELGGSYNDCRDAAYAEKVIAAYMQRWAKDAWEGADAERLARIHNGGPRGHKKRATDGYWSKVERHLAEQP